VKRYVAEPGSDLVRGAMDEADGWFICRVGFIEITRAVSLAAGQAAAKAIRAEWPAFGVIEVDQDLVEHSAALAFSRELRSLDALHLAAALVLPRTDLVLATWDPRLHAGARAEALDVLPAELDY
jgi:predicted nucleic acid-binding protein